MKWQEQFGDFASASQWIYDELPRTPAKVFTGEAGFKRAQKFFELLGNPQDKYSVIHIAGTSGKGTTAMVLAEILKAHGQRAALTLSPHIYDIRERCQINNELVSETAFVAALNQVLPVIKQMPEMPTYYEVLLAIALVHFASQPDINYVILETGLGGTLDATNTVSRPDKVAILTQIGLDHTNVLGANTVSIAAQKAGIIHQGNNVIALKQDAEVETVFNDRANTEGTTINWIGSEEIRAKLAKPLEQRNPQLVGEFHYGNVGLAFAAAQQVAERDRWAFDQPRAEQSLEELKLPGRLEQVDLAGKHFVFDGAHNEQKIAGLVNQLQAAHPHKKFGIIFSCGSTKNGPAMIAQLAPITQELVLTEYQEAKNDMSQLAHHFDEAKGILEAVTQALESHIDTWIVTGSFYLLSEIKQAITEVGK